MENYRNIDDDSIKEILFERITNTYVFKQLTLNNSTKERRKDIIEKYIILLIMEPIN